MTWVDLEICSEIQGEPRKVFNSIRSELSDASSRVNEYFRDIQGERNLKMAGGFVGKKCENTDDFKMKFIAEFPLEDWGAHSSDFLKNGLTLVSVLGDDSILGNGERVLILSGNDFVKCFDIEYSESLPNQIISPSRSPIKPGNFKSEESDFFAIVRNPPKEILDLSSVWVSPVFLGARLEDGGVTARSQNELLTLLDESRKRVLGADIEWKPPVVLFVGCGKLNQLTVTKDDIEVGWDLWLKSGLVEFEEISRLSTLTQCFPLRQLGKVLAKDLSSNDTSEYFKKFSPVLVDELLRSKKSSLVLSISEFIKKSKEDAIRAFEKISQLGKESEQCISKRILLTELVLNFELVLRGTKNLSKLVVELSDELEALSDEMDGKMMRLEDDVSRDQSMKVLFEAIEDVASATVLGGEPDSRETHALTTAVKTVFMGKIKKRGFDPTIASDIFNEWSDGQWVDKDLFIDHNHVISADLFVKSIRRIDLEVSYNSPTRSHSIEIPIPVASKIENQQALIRKNLSKLANPQGKVCCSIS